MTTKYVPSASPKVITPAALPTPWRKSSLSKLILKDLLSFTQTLETTCQDDELEKHLVERGFELDKMGNLFMDNNSTILGVAHRDFVPESKAFGVVALEDETLIFNPRLDDRLGVHTLLYTLPMLGVHLDILITDDEESGTSTGQFFTTNKTYNWIVEFDRRGTDVVDYDFDFRLLASEIPPMGFGSFSDISFMEHLGCKGFNLGIGYHEEHTKRCYMCLEEYLDQIDKFLYFYNKHRDTYFPHIEGTYSRHSTYGYYGDYSRNNYSSEYLNEGWGTYEDDNYDPVLKASSQRTEGLDVEDTDTQVVLSNGEWTAETGDLSDEAPEVNEGLTSFKGKDIDQYVALEVAALIDSIYSHLQYGVDY